MSANRHINTQPLIWLLLSLGIAFALHSLHLHYWIPACFVLCAVWRYYIEVKQKPYPKLWLRLLLMLAGGGAVLASYHSLFGRDVSLALFSVMIALKLLETRTKRDFIVMVTLGYFFTISLLLVNQEMWLVALVLLPLLGLTACLITLSHIHNDAASNPKFIWKTQAKLAGYLTLQAIPIMLVLFVLFPRVPGPIWSIPQDAYSGMTGLSDSMEPGNISQLSLSGKIAFRAEFKSAVPAQNQLYWRGPVLWRQQGKRWQVSDDRLNIPQETLHIDGSPTDYIITLEPHNRRWLLMLDAPAQLPQNALIKHDMQVLSTEPIRTRIRYAGHSYVQYKLGATLDNREHNMALQLESYGNPQTRQLAAKWVKEGKSPAAIVQAALDMFHTQPFVYTLTPPPLGGDSIDQFLFSTRSGFCEHYAGSFVYLMRAAGVPARVVTGYQGGEFNPNGKYLIIRQSDAHAWAEIWLQNRGWVRVDPTAEVSPSRIESGIANALPASDTALLPLLSQQKYPSLRKFSLTWDALNNTWNQWVLSYDQQKQINLLAKITHKRMAWEDMGLVMVAMLAILMLIIAYILLPTKTAATAPELKIYRQFLHKLKKNGLTKLPYEGVTDFAERASNHLPERAQAIQEISSLFSFLQYAPPASTPAEHRHTLHLLKRLVKNFRA